MTTLKGYRARGGPRRQTEWYDTDVNVSVPISGQATVQLDVNLVSDEKKGATITRVLVSLIVFPSAVNLSSRVHMGIVLIEQDAVSAGAFPDVDQMDDQPGWMWRHMMSVRTENVSVRRSYQLVQADIRAQRKYIGEDYQLRLIIDENGGVVEGNCDGLIRVLVKKP